jgi:PAS domain-containing protein
MKSSLEPKRLSGAVFVGVFVFLLVASFLGTQRFLDYEERRDLMNWQITLGVMADQASNRVDSWIREQFSSLGDLAENGSLQLYTANIQQREYPADASVEPAELSYLRNLLRVSADRFGFAGHEGTNSQIPANVAFVADNSLAVLGVKHEIITGTPGISVPDEEVRSVLAQVLEKGSAALIDIRLNQNRKPVIGFVVPVSSLQLGGDTAKPVGLLLGIKDASTHLYPLIVPPPGALKTAKAFLVRREGGYVVNLSPLPDGALPFDRRMGLDTDGTAAVLAAKGPGTFGKAHDETGRECLFTSREIAGTSWVLVQTVLVDEALSESRLHKRSLQVGLTLICLLGLVVFAASWFYGSSLRARALSRELLVKNREIGTQAELLGAITGHVTDLLLLLDSDFRCVLANHSAGQLLGLPPEDMEGKGLPGLFGPVNAKSLLDLSREGIKGGVFLERELLLTFEEQERRFHATVVPFAFGDSGRGSVLLGLHDLTELIEAHLGRERLRRQIVSALMRAIDLHDPHSANHSANTAVIAMAVGRAMGLDDKALATLETASNLCNLGKLSIPREILMKTELLSEAEREIIHQEVRYTEEILAGIEFDGPVIDTILGKYEALDESGPRGLKGEDIILTARVLAAANAFVAMVSPRAYRESLDPEVAAREIVGKADVVYDRHVVAALFHVVENDIDWQAWKARGELVSRQGRA